MIGELLGIASVLTFVTSNAIFHKIDMKLSPSQINAFRTIVGFLTYLIIGLILWKLQYIAQINAITWLWLILSFIFGQVLGDTSYFKAQEMLGTTVALAISMTFPVFSTIFSIVFLKSIPEWHFYISLGLAIVGVIIIAIGKERQERKRDLSLDLTDEESSSTEIFDAKTVVAIEEEQSIENAQEITKSPKKLIFGITLGLVAAISWAAGIVLTEKAFDNVAFLITDDNYTSLIGNLIRFPVAAGILTSMTVFDKKEKIKNWDKKVWLLLLVGSIIGTSLGAYVYTEAVFRSSAAVISIIGASSPLFAIPISWVINKEKSNWISIIGIFVTIAGVVNIFIWELI